MKILLSWFIIIVSILGVMYLGWIGKTLYAYFSQSCLSDVVTCEEIPHTKIYQMTVAQDIKHRLEEKLKTYKPCH